MKKTTDEAIEDALRLVEDKMASKESARDKVERKIAPLERQIEMCQGALEDRKEELWFKNNELEAMGRLADRVREAGKEFAKARDKQNEFIAYATDGHPEFLNSEEVVAGAARITELEVEILGLQAQISKMYYGKG